MTKNLNHVQSFKSYLILVNPMEFTYEAITKDGHKESATIQASNLAAAGHLLKEQGLLPTRVEEQNKKTSFNFFKNFWNIVANACFYGLSCWRI